MLGCNSEENEVRERERRRKEEEEGEERSMKGGEREDEDDDDDEERITKLSDHVIADCNSSIVAMKKKMMMN